MVGLQTPFMHHKSSTRVFFYDSRRIAKTKCILSTLRLPSLAGAPATKTNYIIRTAFMSCWMNAWQTFLGKRIKQRMITIKVAFPEWINERISRLPVSCDSTAIAGTTCYVSRDTNVELKGLQPIARFLHWSRQEVRSLFR